MPENIKNVMSAIDYIESHLHEKLDLETVAGAVHYSKYHLHRMFTGTVGLTIHDYVQRRQLTEVATFLMCVVFLCITATHGNDESPLAFGIDRIIDTTIGIVVALFINQLPNIKYSLTRKFNRSSK